MYSAAWYFCEQLLHEAAFGEASALGSSIYAPNLKKLSVSDVLQYRAAHFVQGNVVVSGNGIAQERLDAAVNQWASAIPAGAARPVPTSAFVGGEVKVRTDMGGASRFGLAFHVPAGDAGTYITLLHIFFMFIYLAYPSLFNGFSIIYNHLQASHSWS